MRVDLFAGMPVTDLERAVVWYERVLGTEPSFYPNDVEAVWELSEHCYLYVEVRPGHAGHGRSTLFVGDFDDRIDAAASRGIAIPTATSCASVGQLSSRPRLRPGSPACAAAPRPRA
jgi:hypothetical protein